MCCVKASCPNLLRRPADSVFQPLSRKPDFNLLLAELGLWRQAHDLRHRGIRKPTTPNQSLTVSFLQTELFNKERKQQWLHGECKCSITTGAVLNRTKTHRCSLGVLFSSVSFYSYEQEKPTEEPRLQSVTKMCSCMTMKERKASNPHICWNQQIFDLNDYSIMKIVINFLSIHESLQLVTPRAACETPCKEVRQCEQMD